MKFSQVTLVAITLWCGLNVSSARAEDRDEAPLGALPRRIAPVQDSEADLFRLDSLFSRAVRAKSDLDALIGLQTVVKSQGKRGTCSIFSATAIVESLLKTEHEQEFDLSENYMEFLVMSKMKSYPSEGSDTDLNIPAIARYGTVQEEVWPYEEYDWTADDLPADESTRADEMCGELAGKKKQVCLLSHLNPDNDIYAGEAKQLRSDYGLSSLSYGVTQSQKQIKRELSANRALVLSVEFFYGAWNHRKMVEYGIGDRDMEKWDRGEVGTPTAMDVRLSRKHGAGHSFVVVGFDDAKRVYYFKNSWGAYGFGMNSDLLGEGTTAGYGTITYDYAHKYGTFYTVSK